MLWRRFSSFLSLFVLSLTILMGILFCFEMKAWGFSQIELSVIFAICVMICYLFSSIVLTHQDTLSTLWLNTILMLLVVILQLTTITFLKDVLQTFFLL
ncbi:MAG: hypothetical protein IJO78_03420 [Erysipelotrichaceae bacterium]|nr:hypothetical protein [Erysipelotrichaceae bacterium]